MHEPIQPTRVGKWDVPLPYPATMHKVVDISEGKFPSASRPLQAGGHATDCECHTYAPCVLNRGRNIILLAQGPLLPNNVLRDGAVTGLFSDRVHGSGEGPGLRIYNTVCLAREYGSCICMTKSVPGPLPLCLIATHAESVALGPGNSSITMIDRYGEARSYLDLRRCTSD